MPDRKLEDERMARGCLRVAGVDEAGRGPLAGPVVAAAVILPAGHGGPVGLDDSKRLSAARREALCEALLADTGIVWALGWAEVEEIDRLNILRATHLAMRRAVEALPLRPDWCLIDGLPVGDFPVPYDAVVKGDGKSLSIAAASIVAKVHRDRRMRELDARYPGYGFARHQGYGTAAHLRALRELGPCPAHRRSFAPVAQGQLALE